MRATTLALSTVLLCACAGSGTVEYGASYSSGGYYGSPDLVTVGPGVQVVADYDESVFYSDGFYWRYYDGGWYRSNDYATGWVYFNSPPVAVLRIDHPTRYRHYHPSGFVAQHRPTRSIQPVSVRDHRDFDQRQRQVPPPRAYQPAPRPHYVAPQPQPQRPAPVEQRRRPMPAPEHRDGHDRGHDHDHDRGDHDNDRDHRHH